MKYCQAFPSRGFANIDAAREWVEKFVYWYNNSHLHSEINFVTPSTRHNGLDKFVLKKRDEVYVAAQAKNPRRWSKRTRNWSRVDVVELNPSRANKKEGNQQAA